MKKLILLSVIAFSLFSCRTIYVDRPIYLSDSIRTTVRDTVIQFINLTDTVKVTVKSKKINPVQIDSKYLFARAWVDLDTLYLSAKTKPQNASIQVKYVDRLITQSKIVNVPVKVYINRPLEKQMYYAGWAFSILLIGALGFGIVKILTKYKIV